MLGSDSKLDFSFLKDLRKPSKQGRQPANLIGQVFGRLTPCGFLGIYKHAARWLCRCACGQFTITTAAHLISGHTTSCGCFADRQRKFGSVTHGQTRSLVYRRWADMLTRATNPNYKQAKDYSERGITVCERWRTFENFLADMGEPPSKGLHLERRNNDLGYSPENCYWATKVEQARNTRANRMITVGDETLCLAAWAERTGIKASVIAERLTRNWSTEEALELIQRTKFLGSYTVYLTANGETRALPDWAKLRGLTKSAIRNRLARGWNHEQALGFQKAPPRSRWSSKRS